MECGLGLTVIHTYEFQADITVTVIFDCACENIDYCRVDGDMAKIFA